MHRTPSAHQETSAEASTEAMTGSPAVSAGSRAGGYSRPARLLGVSALAALTLAACGGDDDDSGSSNAEADVETELSLDLSDDVELQNPGTLQICSDVPYPPFEYNDDDGKIVGFDIDLAEGFAEVFGADLEVVQQGFEGIQSGVALDANSCDLAISGMTITEERAGNMLFSEPYLDDNLALLVAVDSDLESQDDLDGITVGVQADTTGADFAEEQGYDIREYPDSGLLIQGLESGQVDAAIGNISILGYQAGENPDFEFAEEIDTGEQLGVAARTDNQQLIDAVDETLAEMESSGYMDEIEEKWFESGDTPEEAEEDAEDSEDADTDDSEESEDTDDEDA